MNPDVVEPESIAKRDWRIQAISTLAKDFVSPNGVMHMAGSAIEWTSVVAHDKQEVWFTVPSPPALLVALAQRLANSASSAQSRLTELASTKENDELLFELIEDSMGSVVFSITAIEAFANQAIPEDFEWRTPRRDGRFDEVYNRDQIERFVSLDRKLDEILPGIFGVSSPKGSDVWQRYREVAELRDRITHLKNAELQPVSAPTPDNIWTLLLGPLPLDAPHRAMRLIRHFAGDGAIRWIKKCPI